MKKGTKLIKPLGNKDLSPLGTDIPVHPVESKTINKLKSMPMSPNKPKS